MQDSDQIVHDLLETIIEGIKKKKGKEIVILNFDKIENVICHFFIICHGDSNTQVSAISKSIEKEVEENMNIRIGHREGLENSQWLLLDYFDIVVHIFQKEYREYYKLEDLWADAEINKITSE